MGWGKKKLWGMMETFCNLITWVYKFVKIHPNVYLKWVRFCVYTSIKLIFISIENLSNHNKTTLKFCSCLSCLHSFAYLCMTEIRMHIMTLNLAFFI